MRSDSQIHGDVQSISDRCGEAVLLLCDYAVCIDLVNEESVVMLMEDLALIGRDAQIGSHLIQPNVLFIGELRVIEASVKNV